MKQLFRSKVTNFGGEVAFMPKSLYTPRSEGEILDILTAHQGGHIRACGSLHSWNKGIVSKDVLIDLQELDKVEISRDASGAVWAEVGGGCTLERLITELSKSNVTLPTLGAIKRQTISGAISTATHGSGKSSLSNYIEEVRIASYDADGVAKIRSFKAGRDLEAARCAVGCMGVIVSVRFRCLPEYWIEEKDAFYGRITDVISKEREFPLQQFMLLPYDWRYFSFQRQVTEKHEGSFKRELVKLFDFLTFELGTHLLLKGALLLSSWLDSKKLIPGFYTALVPAFLSPRSYINTSADALTLHTSHHYMFRHLEMELFIPERNIEVADKLMRDLTMEFADGGFQMPEDTVSSLKGIGLYDTVMRRQGSYQHHYPIFFRSIESDDALISMSSGGKHYSASFFTYLAPEKRAQYYGFAECMAVCLTELCDARLHWGKHYPLSNGQISHLYPALEEFRRICEASDPHGSFQNEFTRGTLGFKS